MTAQKFNEEHLGIYENEYGKIVFMGKAINNCNEEELKSCICRLYSQYIKHQGLLEGELYSGSKIPEGKFVPLRQR
jgi:hypothetical protein